MPRIYSEACRNMVERAPRETPDYTGEFNEFWASYPRHLKRADAYKAFVRARGLATQALLLEGVERYKRHKPAYADWAHASSWLNGQRWLDEWGDDKPSTMAPAEDWYAECGRIHDHACGLSQMAHHTRKVIDAGKAKQSA